MDDFQRQIRKAQDRVERMVCRAEANPSVSLDKLLNDDFMARHANVPSGQALFDAYPPLDAVEGPEAIKAVLASPGWDAHVAAHTQFGSWSEMLTAAGNEWVRLNIVDG